MPDEFKKTYRLTLDFTVSINDEILQPSSDEDRLDDDLKQALQAQRALLKGLLQDKQGILEELLRKRVLEQARFEAGSDDLKDLLLIRNLSDELLVEPIIDRLSGSHWEYFQEATDDERFEEAAGEAIYAIGVELEAASLVEVNGNYTGRVDTIY